MHVAAVRLATLLCMHKQLAPPDAVEEARLLSPQLLRFDLCSVLPFQRSFADQAEWWHGHFGGKSSEGRQGSEASAHSAIDNNINVVCSLLVQHCTLLSASLVGVPSEPF
jgi:hypothetical protein